MQTADWLDWADNQADLSVCKVHKSIISFVILRLKYIKITQNKSYNTLSYGNMIFPHNKQCCFISKIYRKQ